MVLLKRNPIFTLVCALALLASCAGAYLVFSELTQLKRAEKASAQQQRILNSLLSEQPSLTAANVEAANANVQQLNQAYERLSQSLYGDAAIVGSTNGVQVMASIQEYISDFTFRAKNHVNAEGKLAPVSIAQDLSFGFEVYAEQASIPEESKVIPLLDQQRQILSYVLLQLLASDPLEIVAVNRRIYEGESPTDAKKLNGFKMPKVASAAVKGLIQTIPLKVEFRGYTNSLRNFLNKLAEFKLPILVRSIQVSRQDLAFNKSRAKPNLTSLDDIFGKFGTDATNREPSSAVKAEQKPIISENASNFTLILEYIQIAPNPEVVNVGRKFFDEQYL
jgi:hypothetical protein